MISSSEAARTGSAPADIGGDESFHLIEDHAGDSYVSMLDLLHKTLRPKSYLEIGTLAGATLRLSRCASIAVDPEFQIASDVFGDKPQCHLFQMGSDEFFREHNPTTILNRPIDMSFLDGMHLFEYLLRDFINVETHSRNNSVIAMHDCVPTDSYVALRSQSERYESFRMQSAHPDWWAGDVWKILIVLKKYRQDLRVTVLDAPPTGLVLVTNLNPHDETLRTNYFDVVAQAGAATYAEFLAFIKHHIRPTTSLQTAEDVSREFWL